MLREILQKEYNIYEVSQQVGHYMDYSTRLQLLHYLFGLADSDGVISSEELGVINTISDYMGITNSDFLSVKAMFIKETDSAYKILGIAPSATDDEVKRAYREMAKKNHPDLVSNLGDEVRQAAEKKFQEINAAYETIKKQRGLQTKKGSQLAAFFRFRLSDYSTTTFSIRTCVPEVRRRK
jgi:DnaJ like chaperone protein